MYFGIATTVSYKVETYSSEHIVKSNFIVCIVKSNFQGESCSLSDVILGLLPFTSSFVGCEVKPNEYYNWFLISNLGSGYITINIHVQEHSELINLIELKLLEVELCQQTTLSNRNASCLFDVVYFVCQADGPEEGEVIEDGDSTGIFYHGQYFAVIV